MNLFAGVGKTVGIALVVIGVIAALIVAIILLYIFVWRLSFK